MIFEILQRQYMARATKDLASQLSSLEQAARRDDTLRAAIEREGVGLEDLSNFQAHVAQTAASIGAEADLDACYLPRDTNASLMQSLLQRFCLERKLT